MDIQVNILQDGDTRTHHFWRSRRQSNCVTSLANHLRARFPGTVVIEATNLPGLQVNVERAATPAQVLEAIAKQGFTPVSGHLLLPN